MKLHRSGKVLITGAGGFIGSHLVEECRRQGAEIHAFIRYNSTDRWGWIDSFSEQDHISIIRGDIRDFDSVSNAMKGCDSVFHLAALIGIPYSYYSPLAYLRTNVEGTYNILQAAKEQSIPNVMIVSTSEVYGSAQYVPIDEKHPLSGQSPYSASKIGAEQLAISYHRSFGLPVKVIRPFNTYGPRQSARAIIPSIVTQLLKDPEIIQLGNLHPKRDLTFVKDTVKGMISIADQDKFIGEIVNIGTGQEISIRELTLEIIRIMNTQTVLQTDSGRVRPEMSEVDRLCCDNTRITEGTLWKPEYSLEKGLNETIDWLRKSLTLYKSGIYSV